MRQNAARAEPVPNSQSQNLAWLLKLRWGGIAAQLVIFFAGDRLTSASLPLAPMLLIIGIAVGSNVGSWLWARRASSVPEWALAALMVLDSILLTGMLYLVGGDSSPFAVLYLVNIALAGVLLHPRWTWALLLLSVSCIGFLLLSRNAHAPAATDPLEWQLREMWLAFALASGLIVYFVQRTMRMLRERERATESLRRSAERREKLASLATLAAGAAHELATPLSTIALVSKELERQLERTGLQRDAAADARLIREEVERCRGILSQMAINAGGSAAESVQPVPVVDLVAGSLSAIEEKKRIRLLLAPDVSARLLTAPRRALSQALSAVVKNALQASPAQSEVFLRVTSEQRCLKIAVEDCGQGMSAEILARAGEPFFTTKEPGSGMGLGLFLTRSVLEQLGGELQLVSEPGCGTIATLVLPAAESTS